MNSILKNIGIIALIMLAPALKAKDLTKVGLGIGSDFTVSTKGLVDPEGGGPIPGANSDEIGATDSFGDKFLAKLVHDPIGTAKIAEEIAEIRELVETSKQQLGVLDGVYNEINGMRGQLMNVYNQSFGFIGEAAGLRDDILDFRDAAIAKAQSIIDNFECLTDDDIDELTKKETLLRAKTIDYTNPDKEEERIRQGSTTYFQEYIGPGVYLPPDVKNLSPCGSIYTSSRPSSKAKKQVEELNKIVQETYKESIIEGLKEIAKRDGKSTAEYKQLSEMLKEFISKTSSDNGAKTMAEMAADELELLTIMALTNMEIATHTKNLVILEINNQRDKVYGEYAQELLYEKEVYGLKNVGKEMTEQERRKAEQVHIVKNPNQGLFTPKEHRRY